METQNYETIRHEIIQYMDERGGSYSSWHVGSTSDEKKGMQGKEYIVRKCIDSTTAAHLENVLIGYGCEGSMGFETGVYVFAYAKPKKEY